MQIRCGSKGTLGNMDSKKGNEVKITLAWDSLIQGHFFRL